MISIVVNVNGASTLTTVFYAQRIRLRKIKNKNNAWRAKCEQLPRDERLHSAVSNTGIDGETID